MSPTNRNNTFPTTKPLAVSALVTQKMKKAAPKASTTTITTNGEDIARQILQGTYIHDSDHGIHAALLLFNGAVGISCLCYNLVGLVVRASRVAFSYSLHSQFRGEIGTSTTTTDAFNLIILTKLKGELNKKLLEVKVAADRLADYTKILVDVPVVPVPVSTTSPTVATIAPPAAKAKDDTQSLCRGKHTIKLTAKAQAAAETLK